MSVPSELRSLCQTFWDSESSKYNLSSQSGCGQYTEAWVVYAKLNGYPKVENLKKNPGQTQYNEHAIDAFLWAEPASETNELYSAVDIIAGAEGPNPSFNFGIDEPRYTEDDIWEGESSGGSPEGFVPWVAYDESGFGKLKKQLEYDYSRRPQPADFDVSVWSARVFHSQYMGPEGKPLGQDLAIKKHRAEWCEALGVPVDTHWCADGNCTHGK
jgi:hypothetical protein